MFLKSKGFNFNHRHTDEFDLRIVSIGSSENTQSFGIDRSLETETIGEMITSLKSIKYNSLTFELTLCKTDGIQLLPFSEEDKFEIIRWLFQDDFKPIIFDDQKDVVYYVMFTKGSSYQNGFKQGYLNLSLQLNAPCGFTHLTSGRMRVQGETTFDLFHRSNVEAETYPDIEFELLGDTTAVKIENLTTGETMEFTGLNPKTQAYCYNEGLKQLSCLNNPSYNIRPCFNRTWLRLIYGRNTIKITTTDANVNIIGQTKIALQ